ncbi:MAG TPA: hypothetical protein VH088_10505 [Terriglobales bacterium]|nr:hypothetical protein [Terriglobales bacterium]
MATQVKDAAWLAWIERLVAEAPTSFPPERFHCLLDDQPDHLAQRSPLQSQAWEDLADRPLFLHPDCWMTRGAQSPGDVPYIDHFALQGDVLWLKDPASLMIQPFWLGRELAACVRGLQPDESVSAPAHILRKLFMAGIVVPENFAHNRRRQWAERLGRISEGYCKNLYAPMRSVLHPLHVSALRRYFRHLIRKGLLHLGDEQSSRRFITHNEGVLRFFHQQLTATVSAVAGQKVTPSYVYLGAYQGGAILEKHTDRPQCDFSLTFCLDYSPEPKLETPWPIELHPASGKVTVYQAIGDGLFYRGCRVPHSRQALPEGHSSTSIFFHYVREDFEGSLD